MMKKWVSLLIVLAIVVCAIFLFVGLVFPDVIHTSEEETLIFWDSRPVLNILVNPENLTSSMRGVAIFMEKIIQL